MINNFAFNILHIFNSINYIYRNLQLMIRYNYKYILKYYIKRYIELNKNLKLINSLLKKYFLNVIN